MPSSAYKWSSTSQSLFVRNLCLPGALSFEESLVFSCFILVFVTCFCRTYAGFMLAISMAFVDVTIKLRLNQA